MSLMHENVAMLLNSGVKAALTFMGMRSFCQKWDASAAPWDCILVWKEGRTPPRAAGADSGEDGAFVAACLQGRRSSSAPAGRCRKRRRGWCQQMPLVSLPSHPSKDTPNRRLLLPALWVLLLFAAGHKSKAIALKPTDALRGATAGQSSAGDGTARHGKLAGPSQGKSGRLLWWQHWASSPKLYSKNECKNKTGFVWLVQHKSFQPPCQRKVIFFLAIFVLSEMGRTH